MAHLKKKENKKSSSGREGEKGSSEGEKRRGVEEKEIHVRGRKSEGR